MMIDPQPVVLLGVGPESTISAELLDSLTRDGNVVIIDSVPNPTDNLMKEIKMGDHGRFRDYTPLPNPKERTRAFCNSIRNKRQRRR